MNYMKIDIKNANILIVTLLVLLLTGCNKFLDTIPDNRTEIDNVDKIHKVLCNAYPLRISNVFLEARCDGFANYGVTNKGSLPQQQYDILKGGFYWMPNTPVDIDLDSHKYFWEASYKAISYCNTALEAIAKDSASFDPNEVRMIRAEARISRAYNHFMLLTMFTNMFDRGHETTNPGIPYVTETEDVMFKQYDRGTVASTLDKIKSDLFEEINNIGTGSYYQTIGQQPKFHFTDQAAKAFAVRFCLFTQNYEGVINYANQLIGTPTVFTAASGVNNIDGTPKIYVSTTDPVYVQAGQTLFDLVKYNATGRDVYQPGQMYSNPENPSYYLMTEAQTLAWRSFLGTLLTSYAYPASVVADITSTNPTGGSYTLPTLYFPGDPSGFVVKYYEDMQLVDEVAQIGYVWNKVNLFRLEEVLLARAEANTMLGNFQDAINDLNIYLQRKIGGWGSNYFLDKDKVVNYYTTKLPTAFVNNEFNQNAFKQSGNLLTLQKSLIMSIMDMRRAEFCFEGMRYMDILRWNIPVTHTRMTDNTSHTLYPDDDNRVLQLPATVVMSGLKLNPMSKIRDPWPDIIYDDTNTK